MSYYKGGKENGGVDWDVYSSPKDKRIEEKYLPAYGEGDTMATQAVTAVAKLVSKWYRNGDVYDNTYHIKGGCNDLSSYANWLDRYIGGKRKAVSEVLHKIEDVSSHADYENLLCELNGLFDEDFLEELNAEEKTGTIYECDGDFVIVEEG